jgi:PAS domain S-box-containing protein
MAHSQHGRRSLRGPRPPSGSVVPLINSAGLQLIYKTAPIGLAFLSPDCRYVMINEHLTEICGLPITDHIGRSVRETVPQVAEQVEQLVETIVRSGEPITGVEVHGQRPDGSNKDRVWITYWHPLKNRSGRVIGINVAAEEVTERKRAEAAIAATQERLRNLNAALAERVEAQAQERDRVWNVSQDLLVVSDAAGSVVSVNPAWQTTLGWPSDELVGKRAEWLIHPDDLQRSQTALAGLLAGRTTRHFENRIKHKDGSYRWLSWFAVPDRGLIYASGRDITSLKKTQEQFHRLRRELDHDSRRTGMDEMTASIAHEIRQPLAAIVTSANAGLRWLNRPTPDLLETRTALDHIAKAGSRITEVIESVRSIFGRASTEKSPVDVRMILNEVLELCRGELETNGVSLQDEMRDRLPQVMAAHMQLQQVFLNLITNAIEAMSTTTGQHRCLTISAKLQGQVNILITVEDTGPGIDAAHVDRIFEPFFTTKSRGMGMGLAICRSIIEGHGGTLTASPRRPSGTAFRIILPTVFVSAGDLH